MGSSDSYNNLVTIEHSFSYNTYLVPIDITCLEATLLLFYYFVVITIYLQQQEKYIIVVVYNR